MVLAALQAYLGSCQLKAPPCCSGKDHEELLSADLIDSLVSRRDQVQSRGACSAPDWPGNSSMRSGGSSSSSSPPTLRRLDPLQVRVPPEFELVRQQVLRTATVGSPSGKAPEEQRLALQVCLRAFTRSLLRGVGVNVLMDEQRARLAEARLDSDLTHLVLHVPDAQHPVALKCINVICSPAELTRRPPAMSKVLELSRCCTLVIKGGQFLTFVFDVPRTREYFETCLKVLVLAAVSMGSPAASSCPSPPSGSSASAAMLDGINFVERGTDGVQPPCRSGDAGPAPEAEVDEGSEGVSDREIVGWAAPPPSPCSWRLAAKVPRPQVPHAVTSVEADLSARLPLLLPGLARTSGRST